MQLFFNQALLKNYSSASQKIRVLSEDWVTNYIYCPNCHHQSLKAYPNNRPVADFYCPQCYEEYELKSTKNLRSEKIVDGAYQTMMARLQAYNNPNLFLLNYEATAWQVLNFFVVPRYFFIPEIIEQRLPLALTARRSGWVGCNILLKKIPDSGKIFLVKNKEIILQEKVLKKWNNTLFLKEKMPAKSWLLQVMRCLEALGKNEFSLKEIYAFEAEFKRLYPKNKHIKDKIRQQLQVLREKKYLEFLSPGYYRLL